MERAGEKQNWGAVRQEGDLTKSCSAGFGAQPTGPLDHSLALISAWAVRPQKKGMTSWKAEHVLKGLMAGGCRPAMLLTPHNWAPSLFCLGTWAQVFVNLMYPGSHRTQLLAGPPHGPSQPYKWPNLSPARALTPDIVNTRPHSPGP